MRLIGLCLALLLAAPPAWAKSVALVIGNDAYEHLTPLERAVADAEAFHDRLEARGFQVIEAFDADRRRMSRAVSRFIERVEPGDTAMVVYSGHGVQLDPDRADTLFLLPIDLDGEDIEQGSVLANLHSEAASSAGNLPARARGCGCSSSTPAATTPSPPTTAARTWG